MFISKGLTSLHIALICYHLSFKWGSGRDQLLSGKTTLAASRREGWKDKEFHGGNERIHLRKGEWGPGSALEQWGDKADRLGPWRSNWKHMFHLQRHSNTERSAELNGQDPSHINWPWHSFGCFSRFESNKPHFSKSLLSQMTRMRQAKGSAQRR